MSHTATPELLCFVFQEGESFPQCFELSFYSYVPCRTWFSLGCFLLLMNPREGFTCSSE